MPRREKEDAAIREEAIFTIDYDKALEAEEADRRLPPDDDDEEPDYLSIEATSTAIRGSICHWFTLLTINNIPDVKLIWVKKCWKVGWVKFCIKVPKLYRRKCTITYQMQVCHPDLDAIRKHVLICLKAALASGVAALLMQGKMSQALAAMRSQLHRCLTKRKVGNLDDLKVGIKRSKSCSSWQPV